MCKWMPALLASVIAITGAQAVYAKGTYSYMGAGAMSCGEYVKQEALRTDALQWVLGFITAVNVTRAFDAKPDENISIMNGANVDAIELWLENYCAKNPLDSVTTATIRLVDEALKRSK